ncbi:MAG TPA: lamin tail domain-containing protein [Planctomycetota bacterium]|nr:lamin tail domain-containing protein [Planctomycetota bacterium]
MAFRSAPLALVILAAPALAQGVAPSAGDLVVSEVMINPGPDACVTDNNGEYFAITNISNKVLNLDGIFIQDTVPPGATFFRVNASVSLLPITSVYPGQEVVFARNGDSSMNGNLPNVAYAYTQPAPLPTDNSKIGTASMNFSNSAVDAVNISLGGPMVVPTPNPNGYVQGTLIDAATFDITKAPFTGSGTGQALERIDLFQPMQLNGTANSSNLAISTTVNVACPAGPNTYLGTPGTRNSVDASIWPSAFQSSYMDTLAENTGLLRLALPATVAGSSVTFHSTAGRAGTAYTLGFAVSASEFPFSLIFPGNPGAILLDLGSSQFLLGASLTFDGSGNDDEFVVVPSVPAFVGAVVPFQWLAFDGIAGQLVASNGLNVTIVQ